MRKLGHVGLAGGAIEEGDGKRRVTCRYPYVGSADVSLDEVIN
jgi:hypothetical protein